MAKKNVGVVQFVVVDDSGNVNVEASKDCFLTALRAHIAANADLLAQASAAVQAVFDENVGESFKIPVLTGMAMRKLVYTPETFEALEEAVDDYIHNSPEVLIKKGPAGGVRRVCDIK